MKKNYQKYVVESWVDENNMFHLQRTNDGYSSLELLGVMELIRIEILQQMSAEIS